MPPAYPMLSRNVIPDMPSADELLPYLRQIDDNRCYTDFGPLVGQFETRVRDFLSALESEDKLFRRGEIYVATFATRYDALQIGLRIFRLPPQAHVLVPSIASAACPMAIQHAGAIPVFADVEPGTWHLTPDIARRVAAHFPIQAVMPVAAYGVPVSTAAWDHFVEETGIHVIIDAAMAFETQKVPTHCLLTHSLHVTSPFAAGEGGLLIGRRADWIEESRRLSDYGSRDHMIEQDGINAKMSEYHAAVGLAQLDRWPKVKARRRTMFARIQAALAQAGLEVGFQTGIADTIPGALMLQSSARLAIGVINDLNHEDVMAHRLHLPPLYRHPYFAKAAVASAEGKVLFGDASPDAKIARMRVGEVMQDSVFGVPFHVFLRDADIAHLVTLLARALRHTPASA